MIHEYAVREVGGETERDLESITGNVRIWVRWSRELPVGTLVLLGRDDCLFVVYSNKHKGKLALL